MSGRTIMDLPERLVRELCAVRLAEAAWLGDRLQRDALLRASFDLSHDENEVPMPAPSFDDLALAARTLYAISDQHVPSIVWPLAIASASAEGFCFVERAASDLLASVLLAGADLIARRLMAAPTPLVHVLRCGWPLCGFSRELPGQWPPGHRWVSENGCDAATCERCIAALGTRQ